MAYIRPLKNGNFRADVRMKGIIKNKTFPSRQLAEDWATTLEQNINAIPLMDNVQLLALNDDNIEAMGGNDLFMKLGVDLFSIRNAVKLEVINQLSKKELLQLAPQQIESMGALSYLPRQVSAFAIRLFVKSAESIWLNGRKRITQTKY